MHSRLCSSEVIICHLHCRPQKKERKKKKIMAERRHIHTETWNNKLNIPLSAIIPPKKTLTIKLTNKSIRNRHVFHRMLHEFPPAMTSCFSHKRNVSKINDVEAEARMKHCSCRLELNFIFVKGNKTMEPPGAANCRSLPSYLTLRWIQDGGRTQKHSCNKRTENKHDSTLPGASMCTQQQPQRLKEEETAFPGLPQKLAVVVRDEKPQKHTAEGTSLCLETWMTDR